MQNFQSILEGVEVAGALFRVETFIYLHSLLLDLSEPHAYFDHSVSPPNYDVDLSIEAGL